MYRENSWKKYNDKQEKEVFKFAEGYKDFLSASKTERLAVKEAKARLDKAGYKNAEELKSVKPGDKVYFLKQYVNAPQYEDLKEDVINAAKIVAGNQKVKL